MGSSRPNAGPPIPNAAIDCFYVYPTVSTDPTPNSDMNADPAELNVVRTQFARFGSKCRPYAPMYRQITLAGLRRSLATGAAAPWGAGPHYTDVRDAWNYYLQHDNKGRGVVLVGHSQGSFILIELMRQEIDGKPIQSRIVSAILLGTTVCGAERQGRGRDVQKHPALPQRHANRLLDGLRVISIDRASAGQHALRQGA